MSTQHEHLNGQEEVVEALSKSLSLILADSELVTLFQGKTLSLEQLMGNHSLTEIGIFCIQIDTLLQVGSNSQNPSVLSLSSKSFANKESLKPRQLEQACDCPDGCRCHQIGPLCIRHCGSRPPDLHISSGWLEELQQN